MERQKIAGILDRLQARLPTITRRVGWVGIGLGPVLGMLHIFAMLLMPGVYGRRALSQYDAVERTGDWLAAPLAQYLILIGFALCLLWLGLWVLRLMLAVRARLGSRSI
ncbi:hypothetical protein PSCT_04549 [Pseudomonas sp. SCT]|uniref:hypothetical protein n=1 Tax=Pseudomonas sp. (strain SCT) TaxID=412955 RepID=UPI000EDC530D|nr:hypothetical protein [Pseudomonas sp. SCT]GCA58329.1 hypothetical protein PSCT_04549 [Pseudomonas sp. SCT]